MNELRGWQVSSLGKQLRIHAACLFTFLFCYDNHFKGKEARIGKIAHKYSPSPSNHADLFHCTPTTSMD